MSEVAPCDATSRAATPPKKTPHTLLRVVPVSFTIVEPATFPLSGEAALSVGTAATYVNAFVRLNESAPQESRTSAEPGTPGGVIPVSCDSLANVVAAGTPANVTTQSPRSRAPLSVTGVPPVAEPLAGETEKSTGVTGASATSTNSEVVSEPNCDGNVARMAAPPRVIAFTTNVTLPDGGIVIDDGISMTDGLLDASEMSCAS